MDLIEANDLGTLYFLGSLHRPWLDTFMVGLTHLGDTLALLLVVVVATVVFLVRRRPLTAALLMLNALSAYLIEYAGKSLVHRPRPEVVWLLLDLPSDSSFPSGHALKSMAVYAFLALVVARTIPRRGPRLLALAVGFLLPLGVGLSRAYLGVHYPIDVLAGWCAGLGCALLAAEAAAFWERPPTTRPFATGTPPPAPALSPVGKGE